MPDEAVGPVWLDSGIGWDAPHAGRAVARSSAEGQGTEHVCSPHIVPYLFSVAWLREFCRTLEIITRTLREVVNRVRLCGHHNPFEVFSW